MAIVALIAVAAYAIPGEPASFRVEGNTLIVIDARGRECWRKVLPWALTEALDPKAAAAYTWIGDLDGDGHNEVLFAPHPQDFQQSSPLICFSHRGQERWRFTTQRPVRTSQEEFSPVYGAIRFLVTPLGKGLPNAILVSFTHRYYYPCRVVLLDTQGRILREYWHSGHLNFLGSGDLDGDGRSEFYLAGINNAYHAATLVVLDMDHFSGASQEPEAPDHQLLGMAPGVDRARIILPRSCLNTASDPYNSISDLTVSPSQIMVETMESIYAGAGILHHFSPDLRQHRAELSDSYRMEYRRAIQAGRIAACAAETLPV